METMNAQQPIHMQPANGGYWYNGYQFQGQPQPVHKINNILSAEDINSLTAQSEFDLGISEQDYKRTLCNHRSIDGEKDTLTYDPVTGVARCTICGYTFRPIESGESIEDIKAAVAKIIDILQTIKILYVDLPPQAHKEIFPMLAMLEKVPQLFEFAAKNFSKHEAYNWQYSHYNMNGVQMLANLNNVFGGGMYQQPYGNPYGPQMGGQWQQPMMNQWQQPQNVAPMAPQPMGNPFGYPGAQSQNAPFSAPMGNPYQPQPYGGFTPQPAQSTTPATPTVDVNTTTEKNETAEVKKSVVI